jgi:hypothetical protein
MPAPKLPEKCGATAWGSCTHTVVQPEWDAKLGVWRSRCAMVGESCPKYVKMFWDVLRWFRHIWKNFFLGQKRQNFCCFWNVACMSSAEPRQNQMVHPDHFGMNVGRSTMPKNGTGPNEESPVNRWRRRRRNRPGNHSGLMKTCDPNLQNDPNGLIFLKQRWKGLKLIALNKFDLNIFEPNFAHVQH